MKQIITINPAKTRLLTTASNREVKVNNPLVDNISKSGGMDVLPIVFRAELFCDQIRFQDLYTREDVEFVGDNDYLVADGQNRFYAINTINEKASVDKANSFHVASVDVALYDEEELRGRTISQFIANINSTSKPWKHGDYIHHAYKEKPDDDLINIINNLKNFGMPISTISRLLTFSPNAINDQTILDYIQNAKLDIFQSINIARGLQILILCLTKGFNSRYMCKRYLIDTFISQCLKGRLSEYMVGISQLTQEEVDVIQAFSHDDYKNGSVVALVRSRIDIDKKNPEQAISHIVDIPTDDISINMIALHEYVAEVISKKSKKQTHKEKAHKDVKKRENDKMNEIAKFENII